MTNDELNTKRAKLIAFISTAQPVHVRRLFSYAGLGE